MKLTSKGQVTIPLSMRKRYGLDVRTEVVFEEAPGGVLIKPAPDARLRRLKLALRHARGSANAGLSTAQIMRQTRSDDE